MTIESFYLQRSDMTHTLRAPTPIAGAGKQIETVLGDHLLAELLEVVDRGYDSEDYLALRGLGYSHEESWDAIAMGIMVSSYQRARKAGVTHDEVMEVQRDHSVGLKGYLRARGLGASHKDVMGRDEPFSKTAVYATAVEGGATRIEMAEVAARKWPGVLYAKARAAGISHEEFGEYIEFDRIQEGAHRYTRMRVAGAAHDEALSVLRSGSHTKLYAQLRESGKDHASAMSTIADLRFCQKYL